MCQEPQSTDRSRKTGQGGSGSFTEREGLTCGQLRPDRRSSLGGHLGRSAQKRFVGLAQQPATTGTQGVGRRVGWDGGGPQRVEARPARPIPEANELDVTCRWQADMRRRAVWEGRGLPARGANMTEGCTRLHLHKASSPLCRREGGAWAEPPTAAWQRASVKSGRAEQMRRAGGCLGLPG